MAAIWAIFLLFSVLKSSEGTHSCNHTRPDLYFIFADDLGWNDVGFHNDKMWTPNMDGLAKKGVILKNAYVHYLCTPSRSAFMSGYYSHRLGLNLAVIGTYSPFGVPLKFKLLSEYLLESGYSTHAVGKWHLGSCHPAYWPTNRGFQTNFGYMMAAQDQYLHTLNFGGGFYDFFNGSTIAPGYSGTFTPNAMLTQIQHVLSTSNANNPMFMYVTPPTVHCPVQYPAENDFWYTTEQNIYRKKYSAYVTALDAFVGQFVKMLKDHNRYENSIIVLTADNGGEPFAGGNNYPLRGKKANLWEGGVRGVSFVHSPKHLNKTGYTYKGLIHVTDWFATFLNLACLTPAEGIDGVNVWDAISNNLPSPRKEVVPHLSRSVTNTSKYDIAYRYGNWKLITGDQRGPNISILPGDVSGTLFNSTGGIQFYNTESPQFQLYNLKDDPSESNNLANAKPHKVQELYQRLQVHIQTQAVAFYDLLGSNQALYQNKTVDPSVLNIDWCEPIQNPTPMFPETSK